MSLIVALIALLGFCLTFYAYWVDRKLLQNSNYKPVCDISEKVSCSKPFASPYSQLLGFSNTIIGIVFYTSMFWLAITGFNKLLFIAAVGSAIASVYLAYILFAKVKSLCLICISIYIVNILLLIAAFYNL